MAFAGSGSGVCFFRDEHGLRRVSGAEPQVVGLAPQTTMNDRKANTMKTYILRDPKAVEPQKRQRNPQDVIKSG